ncbi:MAG: imidazolonepropionase, partial [Desulfamplus sp.]|nr:imidazolonepropionase [Desulfamplus sp.]
MIRKLFKNAKIYTPIDGGSPPSGKDQGILNHFPRGEMLVENGIIKAIGDAG